MTMKRLFLVVCVVWGLSSLVMAQDLFNPNSGSLNTRPVYGNSFRGSYNPKATALPAGGKNASAAPALALKNALRLPMPVVASMTGVSSDPGDVTSAYMRGNSPRDWELTPWLGFWQSRYSEGFFAGVDGGKALKSLGNGWTLWGRAMLETFGGSTTNDADYTFGAVEPFVGVETEHRTATRELTFGLYPGTRFSAFGDEGEDHQSLTLRERIKLDLYGSQYEPEFNFELKHNSAFGFRRFDLSIKVTPWYRDNSAGNRDREFNVGVYVARDSAAGYEADEIGPLFEYKWGEVGKTYGGWTAFFRPTWSHEEVGHSSSERDFRGAKILFGIAKSF